jgi:hypothetical protein
LAVKMKGGQSMTHRQQRKWGGQRWSSTARGLNHGGAPGRSPCGQWDKEK